MGHAGEITVRLADVDALQAVMPIMHAAFDPSYGEAWNTAQCASILSSPSTWLMVAEQNSVVSGFALTRAVAGEAELLLIAVHPDKQGKGIATHLLNAVIAMCLEHRVERLFLEVRSTNSAISLYVNNGFFKVGERRNYYRGVDGKMFDAHSYSLPLKKNRR